MLSLIEENTAAALHYGIDRVFEEPNTVVYYNMGASAVQVSVATYSAYQVRLQMGGRADVRRRGRRRSCPLTCL